MDDSAPPSVRMYVMDLQTARSGPSLRPHQIWWAMLVVRIDQVKSLLPAKLQGTLQFEILTRGGTTEFYHLTVDGPRTKGGAGLAKDHDVWINTTEGDLEDLLFSEDEVTGALRASGNVTLFTDLLDLMAKQAGPANLLQLRSKKS